MLFVGVKQAVAGFPGQTGNKEISKMRKMIVMLALLCLTALPAVAAACDCGGQGMPRATDEASATGWPGKDKAMAAEMKALFVERNVLDAMVRAGAPEEAVRAQAEKVADLMGRTGKRRMAGFSVMNRMGDKDGTHHGMNRKDGHRPETDDRRERRHDDTPCDKETR